MSDKPSSSTNEENNDPKQRPPVRSCPNADSNQVIADLIANQILTQHKPEVELKKDVDNLLKALNEPSSTNCSPNSSILRNSSFLNLEPKLTEFKKYNILCFHTKLLEEIRKRLQLYEVTLSEDAITTLYGEVLQKHEMRLTVEVKFIDEVFLKFKIIDESKIPETPEEPEQPEQPLPALVDPIVGDVKLVDLNKDKAPRVDWRNTVFDIVSQPPPVPVEVRQMVQAKVLNKIVDFQVKVSPELVNEIVNEILHNHGQKEKIENHIFHDAVMAKMMVMYKLPGFSSDAANAPQATDQPGPSSFNCLPAIPKKSNERRQKVVKEKPQIKIPEPTISNEERNRRKGIVGGTFPERYFPDGTRMTALDILLEKTPPPEDVPGPSTLPPAQSFSQAPVVPTLPQAPVVPILSLAPAITELLRAPVVPKLPRASKIPTLPRTPAVPNLPQAPGVPAVPKLPLAAAVPAPPRAPKVPKLPRTIKVVTLPQAPVAPYLPQASIISSLSQIPAVPKVHRAAAVPAPSQAPIVPTIMRAPAVPKLPQASLVPTLHQVAALAALGRAPKVPKVPRAAAVPTPPQAPIVPILQQAPAVPKLPQVPVVPILPLPPAAPKLPRAAAFPGPPQAPMTPTFNRAPAVPKLFRAPVAPTLPKAPAAPAPPQAPMAPTLNRAPAAPAFPRAPALPILPRAPEVPTLPLAAIVPALPQARLVPAPRLFPAVQEEAPVLLNPAYDRYPIGIRKLLSDKRLQCVILKEQFFMRLAIYERFAREFPFRTPLEADRFVYTYLEDFVNWDTSLRHAQHDPRFGPLPNFHLIIEARNYLDKLTYICLALLETTPAIFRGHGPIYDKLIFTEKLLSMIPPEITRMYIGGDEVVVADPAIVNAPQPGNPRAENPEN